VKEYRCYDPPAAMHMWHLNLQYECESSQKSNVSYHCDKLQKSIKKSIFGTSNKLCILRAD
jgi:hypothetical protein